ncbi:protein translocase subunit SecF [Blastochloris sulfoviridis]|uniref:Protein-export membrane protein SecF n=1 Tax=Blastochloris sulfoviridis TaxID=50712 RepID=A0A5M6I1N6_9HYPH|nr:protein translocase subunit SecF [Blastochloris sulfoviridis]KAA5602093.1 protein translocase subunit SecF [Blastochloris sulfoviridis]NJL09034.1 protein translocase subunit SecF [Candidatus Methylacidiphilales bacterium]
MRLLRLVPANTKLPFMAWRRLSFPLSAVLSILSLLLFLTVGMNFGIDFMGGTMIEVQSKSGPANISEMRNKLGSLDLGDVQIQQFGAPTDVLIRIQTQPGGDAAQQAVVDKVKGVLGADVEYRRVEVVGPQVSKELVQGGTIGSIVAILGIILYLWFRFEWQFAIGATVATMHDIVLTIGFFAITQIEFNSTSIAAILTIMGYSVNDTVVIYDRIREMLRKYKRISTEELLDIAMNSTLSRTVYTGSTTLLAMIALYSFGGEVIRSFTAAMIFGVVIGTYSSAFIAAPFLIYLGVKTQGQGKDKDKVETAAPAKA